MSLLKRRSVLLAKIETTQGTDASPTAANDALEVINPEWGHVDPKMLTRGIIRANLTPAKQIYAGHLLQFTFQVELAGSGSAGVAPDYGPVLRAAFLSETIVASTSVAYAPVSSSPETITMYGYFDGKLRKLVGGVAMVDFAFAAQDTPKANFTVIGHDGGESDTAIVSPTLQGTVPTALKGLSSLNIGAFAADIASLTLDLGNVIAKPESMLGTDGIGNLRVSDRDPKGSFDPEETLKATYDPITLWKVGTEAAFESGQIGTAAGNIIRLQMPKVSYREIAPGEREGIRTWQLGFGCADDSGDDAVALTFT